MAVAGSMLRVHSRDLHEHIAQEAGDSLASGSHTDLAIRCQDGETLPAHRLVLAAVSPYLRQVLDLGPDSGDSAVLDLPDTPGPVVKALLEIVYTGSIEATLAEMRALLTLAHSLYISVPVSDQLVAMLGLQLPPQPALQPGVSHAPARPQPAPSLEFPALPQAAAMSLLQQQIFGQYAMMNGLLGEAGQAGLQPQPDQSKDLLGLQMNSVIMNSFRPENGCYVCSVCQSSYTNKGNFRQHMEKHFKNEEFTAGSAGPDLSNGKQNGLDASTNMYKCHVCHSTYSHPGNFKQHLLKHEREKRGAGANSEGSHLNSVLQSAFADRVDNGDPCKTYICHECNRTFKHPGNFKQHMASHNKQVVTAPNFPVENLLRRPMPGLVKMVNGNAINENHPTTPDWDCPECSAKFAAGPELQIHMKSEHNIEMVLQPEEAVGVAGRGGAGQPASPVSPPMLNSEQGLKALAMAAGADRVTAQFHCDAAGCYQSFTTEGWLMRHKARQHTDLSSSPAFPTGPGRSYPCTQCGKQFGKMSKLTQHLKTHSPEDHYKHPCDICGKKFTRPQHVIRHKLLHTGEKPHSCPNCDKSFAREDKLKHHLLKGCAPLSLDQSIDSRDSGDRDSETSDIALRREAALMKEDDLEIDDDEEGMEEGGGVTGEPGK